MTSDTHRVTLSVWRHSEFNRGSGSRYHYHEGQGWYLDTREGLQGPFPSRDAAQDCLRRIIQQAHAQRDRRTPPSSR